MNIEKIFGQRLRRPTIRGTIYVLDHDVHRHSHSKSPQKVMQKGQLARAEESLWVISSCSHTHHVPAKGRLHKLHIHAKVKSPRLREKEEENKKRIHETSTSETFTFTTDKIADRPARMGFMISATNANPFVHLPPPFFFFCSLPSNELGADIEFFRDGSVI